MILSILIPTLEERVETFNKLWKKLSTQIGERNVEIVWWVDNGKSVIGNKRNILLDLAVGKYVCFIDDDDDISDNYIDLLLKAAEFDCDCASLKGVMTTNGENPEVFEHSVIYNEWKTTDREVKYERFPNHLNMIRADIAKRFKFPEKSYGEDHDWSKQLHEAKVLKTEFYIDDIIYYYKYVQSK